MLADEDLEDEVNRENGSMEELRLNGIAFGDYNCLLLMRGGDLDSGCFLDSVIWWGH